MQDNFEPIYLKKAQKTLDKHLESHKYAHEKYKERLIKKHTLWKKIKYIFHLD